MGFSKIERKPSGKGAVAKQFVKARCWGKRFELLFSEDLWEGMGSPPRIGILVGTGQDDGKIAIEPDPIGYMCNRASPGSHLKRIYISNKKMGLAPFESTVLKFRLTKRGKKAKPRLLVYLKSGLQKIGAFGECLGYRGTITVAAAIPPQDEP